MFQVEATGIGGEGDGDGDGDERHLSLTKLAKLVTTKDSHSPPIHVGY
jgi:hypothetical protein